MEKQPILEVRNLVTAFKTEDEFVKAVNDISFTLHKGETIGIVGESGSGKSVTSLSVMQLIPSPPGKIIGGEIIYHTKKGKVVDLVKTKKDEMREYRGNEIAMIFQEPMTSLNPVFTCGHQVMEAILIHKKISKTEAKQKTIEWFGKVRLPEPEKIFYRYPHQLSGGQKQRISIARALMKEAPILILDDCLSAVDARTEKEIITNLRSYLEGRTSLLITHRIFSLLDFDKIIVLEEGRIVEEGRHEALMERKGVYFQMYRRQQQEDVEGGNGANLAVEKT